MRPALRALVVCSAAVLGSGSLLAVSAPAGAATACVDTGGSYDFNGDGVADQVAGDPGATVSGKAKAGRIDVRYGKAGGGFGSSTTIAQGSAQAGGTAETNDGFGQTLAVGFVDGDRCADVVVGTPGENLGAFTDIGQVEVLFGTSRGLGVGRAPLVLSGTTGTGEQTDGARYGAALALISDPGKAADPEEGTPAEPHYAYLAVGVPGLLVGGHAQAGGVVLFSFDDAADSNIDRLLTQSTVGAAGAAEEGDRFGSSLDFLSRDLVVGIPGENDGAGAIEIFDDPVNAGGQVGQVLSQATSGMAGAAEKGDGFGTAVDAGMFGITGTEWVAVGIPGEDVGDAKDAGSVQLLCFCGSQGKILNSVVGQDSKGIADKAEAGDRFGASVHLDTMWARAYYFGVAVGVPGEDVGSLKDAGAVAVMLTSGSAVSGNGDVLATQNSYGVPGKAEAGERFGSVLGGRNTAGSIGVPDDKGYAAGVVIDVSWTTLLLGAGSDAGTAWTVSGGSRFGAALG